MLGLLLLKQLVYGVIQSVQLHRRNWRLLDSFVLMYFYVVIALIAIFPVPTTAKAVKDENDVKELPVRTASQCFNVRGVPVINLRCGRNELIRIVQAFYGAVPADVIKDYDRATPCSYSREDGDCIQLTTVKEHCMGRSVCTLPVSNPFLRNCEQYASYLQVNFTCVPRERIQNICESSEITTWKGYISTPRYPLMYPADTFCQCSLKTKDRSILLTILDFSLMTSGKPAGRCAEDKLHIEGWGDKCNPVVPEGLPETLGLREKALTLRLETDDRKQGRGFWIEFRGSNGGKVTMTCGQRPKPPRTTQITNNVSEPSPKILRTKDIVKVTESSEDNEENITPTESDDTWPPMNNESTSEYEDTTDVNNVVIVDDGELDRLPPDNRRRIPPEEFDNEFDTYDFSDHADQYQLYNVGHVQLATGIVVSVLILVAVVIIIVLVFRR